MTALADRLLPEQLLQRLQPLLPPPPSHARGGAPRTVSDRACMAAILFMARTSTPWALLPVDRGKAGSKLHLAGEADGLPLTVLISAANANDSTMLEAVLDDIPAIRMPTGRRRRRPTKVHADKAYDHRRCRAYLRRRGIRPRIARRRIESSERLGRHRWRIERTGAWLGGWRRLRIRYERDSERFYALAMLACAVICFNALQRPPW